MSEVQQLQPGFTVFVFLLPCRDADPGTCCALLLLPAGCGVWKCNLCVLAALSDSHADSTLVAAAVAWHGDTG